MFFYNCKSTTCPRDGFAEITDSRNWQTNVYEGIYFNNFIKSNLVNEILKRHIMNSMSGSSWRFKRFDRLCITVNSDKLRSIGNENIFDVMEFIEKYARVKGSEDEMEHDDDAGGDEVNQLDLNFIGDKTNFQDQEPTDYRLMHVARDLQDAIADISMAFDLDLVAVEILFLTLLTRSVMNLMIFLVLRNVFKSLIRNLNFLRKNQKVPFTFLYSTLLSFAREKGRFLFLPR